MTAATGGAAAVAAPAIAAALAGEAVAGLSGAALTSASLAWVGGGSLAAGGLGMAGGTAIITGGGAFLGLTTATGGALLVGALSKDYAEQVKQGCVERLAYCSVLLEEEPVQALAIVEDLRACLERAADTNRRTIEALQGAKNADQKKQRKSLKEAVSHIDNAVAELGRLEKKAREAALESGGLVPSTSTDVARAGDLD